MVDGVYAVRLFGGGIINVYCDMTTDGGGWTVFQKRVDGSINFNRNWTQYRQEILTYHALLSELSLKSFHHCRSGFGNVNSEFWLGLENLHLLVTDRNSSLRVDLWDWEGSKAHAYYSIFHIGDRRHTNYTLTVDGYQGDAGDALGYHSNMKFSTPDWDNDQWPESCAVNDGAGWWYKGCSYASLNNKYYNMDDEKNKGVTIIDGINWYHWKETYSYSVKRVEMKTRPMQDAG